MTRSVARSLCDSWASLLIMTMMTSSIQPLALHDEMKFTSTKPLWLRDCLSSRNSMTNRLLLSSVKYSTSKTRERSVGQGQCSSRYMAERCNICCWNECRVIVGPPPGGDWPGEYILEIRPQRLCYTLSVDVSPGIYLRTVPPPDNYPPHLGYFPRLLKGKLALTRTPLANRSTCINFIHVNGRSLYIVDWPVVVV